MTKHTKRPLVIFAEAALERLLVREVKRLGAHGYTVHDVRGPADGARDARDGRAPVSVHRAKTVTNFAIEICSVV